MTLSKNGKRIGRPLGSKNRTKVKQDNRRLNQAKVIGELEERLFKLEYENFQFCQERELDAQKIQQLRKDLAEAQIAVLDGVAVIRYLEKKVYDLVKAEQK